MRSPFDLDGRRFVVTGASSGIGGAACTLLASLGARLVAVGRDAENLDRVMSTVDGDGHETHVVDLTTNDLAAWARGVSGSGPVNGLIHCAGMHALRPLRITDSRVLRSVFDINVTAGIELARLFSTALAATSGSIVFLGSVTGLVGQAGHAAYAASKGAVVAASRALAIELAAKRIRVNCVAPGVVDTRMSRDYLQLITEDQRADLEARHPLGWGRPEDVAAAIAFLVSDGARWVTGATLVVDGGYSAQ